MNQNIEHLRSTAARTSSLHELLVEVDGYTPTTEIPTVHLEDLAVILRVAAQLVEDDEAGDLTLADWPDGQALVDLANRLYPA